MGIVIETAIGLILVFFLFSMLASAIQELIAGFWNSRGRMLQQAVIQLLDGTRPGLPAWPGVGGNARTTLSNITTWIGLLCNALGPNFRANTDTPTLGSSVLRHGLLSGLSRDDRVPSYIPAERFADALLDVFRVVARDSTVTLDGLRYAASRLPEGPPRNALSAILATAANVAQVRTGVIAWYSDAMDRVSGWYARHVRLMLLILGLVLAVGMNADVIYMSSRIAKDASLRNLLVQTAQTTVADTKASPQTGQQTVSAAVDQINKIGLPIGWPACNIRPPGDRPDCKSSDGTSPRLWLQAGVGWVIMALAISMGAPFWFDLLQQVVALRASGPEPATPAVAGAAAPSTAPAHDVAVADPAAPPGTGPRSDFEMNSLSQHDLRLIQARLGVGQSGAFDSATRTAIVAFQRRTGAAADGVLTRGQTDMIAQMQAS